MKGAAMVDSNYLEELLEGIPDGLFDGNYSEEDLLKMVDLPMESFANYDSHTEFDVNEMNIPWPCSSYVDYKPVDSAVWNDTVSEQKPNLIPLNSSVSLPEPISSDDSVSFPLVVGGNGTNHINVNTGLGTQVDVKPTVRSLNGLLSKSWSIPSYCSSVHISDTAPIPLAAIPESKPKLIPSNPFVTESNPMVVDTVIDSCVVVEHNVSKNTVDKACTGQKPDLADGKPKVVKSGSSRIHSPVSVLDTRNCNSVQTSMSNIITSKKGARYGKRSKRPRSEHIKTPWFQITLIPPVVSSKKRNTSQGSDRYTKTESKLFEFPSCWKKQTMASPEGVIGTTKKCSHCEVTKTPQWREGPNGPKTLCNACGVRYRSGRLFPEYRPAASPTFTPYLHSNSHRKVIEMRKLQGGMPENIVEQDFPVAGDTVMDYPRSPDSPLIENIPMIGHPFELIY